MMRRSAIHALKTSTPSPAQTRRLLGLAAFWLGVTWLMLGSIVTFIPGTELKWFVTAAVMLVGGLLIPRWPYRIAALLLIAYCITAAIASRDNGLKYRLELQQRAAR